MAEAADNMTSEDPGALMKRILANRKSIAKAQFDMIASIGRMRSTMSDDDLRSFLVVECGIPRSDLPSIFAFDETLGSCEPLLRKRCVPFHVVKALIATDADTRQAALDALADGTEVDVPTVARLRRLTIQNRIGACRTEPPARDDGRGLKAVAPTRRGARRERRRAPFRD